MEEHNFWALPDFGKPLLGEAAPSKPVRAFAQISGETKSSQSSWQSTYEYAEELQERYGAPKGIHVQWEILSKNVIGLTVSWKDKVGTRIPEAVSWVWPAARQPVFNA